MKFRLWNNTTVKWVRDEDGNICEFDHGFQAEEALARIRDIQQLNPKHKDDMIEIITHRHETDQQV